MKVSFDLRNNGNKNSAVAFEGYKVKKSDNGFIETEFAYPYDTSVYKGYLEIYKVGIDNAGNYYTTGKAYTRDGQDKLAIPDSGHLKVDLAKTFGFDEKQPYAYRFRLENSSGYGHKTKIDSGDVINENGELYNIVSPSKSNLSRGGSMKLVIVDSQNVGYVYNDQNKVVRDAKIAKRGETGIKSLTNKFGGTLAGLEHAIDKGDYDNYSRIISLPIFTDDDFSAHSYWNKNCMQMVHSLGNINNYASFQRKMFAHGLNLVSDGAFVNEGLEGVHFGHVLKWGEDSPYYCWFRASGLQDGPLSLGVFSKNKDFISHKIVNSPYTYTKKSGGRIVIGTNHNYDKTKPTYIQFFDSRLVTEDEKKDTTSLIKTYSRMSTSNVYDLHTHDDSIFPYHFEIRPEVYNKNIRNLNAYNSIKSETPIDLDSPMAARILSKSDFYVVDNKFESGFETWDANVDIAKLNFVYSNTDTKSLKSLPKDERDTEIKKIVRGNYQVQDYAITSGKYWTRKTDDILRLYVAHSLKSVDAKNPTNAYNKIIQLSDNKVLPASTKFEVSKEEVLNVIDGLYNNKRVLSDAPKKEQILEGVMNTHLDAIEFGDNLTAILASPLISKRANDKSEIGVPRYEIYKKGNVNLPKEYETTYKKMDEIFAKDLTNFAEKVLDNIDATLPENRKLFNNDEVTEYGKYVLPLVLPEITKYAIVKSLAPKTTVIIDKNTGELAYDYKKLKEVSVQSFGIHNIASPEDEALIVLDELKKGIKRLDSSIDGEIAESVDKSLKDTTAETFKLADLIIDKTQSGLDWRIDATKDIADVEALRNGLANFNTTWGTIIDFWKKFVDGVQQENPNAYTVAEITNHIDLHNDGFGWASDYPDVRDIIPKFLRKTGMTSTADYSYWFRPISKIFSNDFEDGSKIPDKDYASKMIYETMFNIMHSAGLDSLMYSYTFIGNHDKPRALHCAALDMELFYSDLTYPDNKIKRRIAYQVLNDKFMENITDSEVEQYDFSAVSPKAIAMADAIRPGLIDVLNDYKNSGRLNDETFNNAFRAVSKAVAELAGGTFRGHRFDPEAFGTKPIDVAISMVLQQAKAVHNFQLPADLNKEYENQVFEKVMTPAVTKVLGMMKYLVALPGIPTLFDGDDMGGTGYDTKTKNMFLDGRQKTHEEWITPGSPKYKDFLAKYKMQFDKVMGLRKKPECNALNNGAIYNLPLNRTQNPNSVEVSSILRQSTDGRMAISIFNPRGITNNRMENYTPRDLYIDKLYFGEVNNEIGIPGLKRDTVFLNADNPKDTYVTRQDNNGGYYLVRMYDNREVPIKLDGTTMVLYHVPNNTPLTFTGQHLMQPSGKFVANAYKQKTTEQGKKLALISK